MQTFKYPLGFVSFELKCLVLNFFTLGYADLRVSLSCQQKMVWIGLDFEIGLLCISLSLFQGILVGAKLQG